jgi:hypothetical protein
MTIADFVLGRRERLVVARTAEGAELRHLWQGGSKLVESGSECDVVARFADLIVEVTAARADSCAGCDFANLTMPAAEGTTLPEGSEPTLIDPGADLSGAVLVPTTALADLVAELAAAESLVTEGWGDRSRDKSTTS